MTKHQWTNDAVHDIVAPWPDLARASIGWAPGERQWVQTNGDPLTAALAAAAHVASGLERLATDRQGIRVFPPTDDRPSWYIDDNWNPPMMAVRGPTLLHAVSAAIMAAGGCGQ